jgi:hypothetical protein
LLVGLGRDAAEQGEQGLRGGWAFLRLLGQAPPQDVGQRTFDPGQVRGPGCDLVRDGGDVTGVEGRSTSGGIGNGASPGEHVRRGADLVAAVLLGCHVVGGADHVLGQCDGWRQVARDAEVDHPWAQRAEDHVRWLEIAVHHMCGVDGYQRSRGADGHPMQVAPTQRAGALDVCCQGRAFDELGDNVGHLSVDASLDHLRGAERCHLGRGCHFSSEPASCLSVLRPSRPQHFDRAGLPRWRHAEEHHALAAFTKPAQYLVRADPLREITGLSVCRPTHQSPSVPALAYPSRLPEPPRAVPL